jgi:hypothetical protein
MVNRPPEVSEDNTFTEIKKELSENIAGWRAKEVMNIIYERERKQVYDIMKFISIDYYINGASVQRFQGRDL